MGRIYTVSFSGTVTAAGADTDWLEILPADDKPVKLRGLKFGQISEVGDTAEGGVWSALGNGHHSGPAGAVSTMGTAQSSDNSGTITWTTSSLFGGIIVEVKAAKAPPPFQKHSSYVWRH